MRDLRGEYLHHLAQPPVQPQRQRWGEEPARLIHHPPDERGPAARRGEGLAQARHDLGEARGDGMGWGGGHGVD